jgi:hypothetical protein
MSFVKMTAFAVSLALCSAVALPASAGETSIEEPSKIVPIAFVVGGVGLAALAVWAAWPSRPTAEAKKATAKTEAKPGATAVVSPWVSRDGGGALLAVNW